MLVEAGVVTKDELDNIERIVIGCDASQGTVGIYTKKLGDEESLRKLAPMLKGML